MQCLHFSARFVKISFWSLFSMKKIFWAPFLYDRLTTSLNVSQLSNFSRYREKMLHSARCRSLRSAKMFNVKIVWIWISNIWNAYMLAFFNNILSFSFYFRSSQSNAIDVRLATESIESNWIYSFDWFSIDRIYWTIIESVEFSKGFCD